MKKFVDNMNKQDNIKLLNSILFILCPSHLNDSVYRTPAMALREQADRIEWEAEIIGLFKQFIEDYEKLKN